MFYRAPKKGNGGRTAESNSLKDMIDAMYKTFHLDKKFNEVTIINSWPDLVGKMIASKTSDIFIRKKVLSMGEPPKGLKVYCGALRPGNATPPRGRNFFQTIPRVCRRCS